MTNEDWSLPNLDFLGVEMRMAQGTPAYEPRFGAIYLTFNRGPDVCINLPEPPQGQHWKRALDTGDGHAKADPDGRELIEADTVVAYKLFPIQEMTP